MANLSKEKREGMFSFINKLKELNKTDDAVLVALGEIEKALKSKKYGLVWEEHSEVVDERLRSDIPVFSEQKDKEITTPKITGGGIIFY